MSTTAVPPAGPPVVLGTGNNILISPLQVCVRPSLWHPSLTRSQRGNQVLDNIKNVGKEFSDIVADYQVGRTTGVLFLRSVLRCEDSRRFTTLSLKYHRLHPEYIHIRIEKLGHSYTLRILLVLCDITEHRDAIRELTKATVKHDLAPFVSDKFQLQACLINNITVLVAFSFEEAGHYLSTLKQFEHKPPDMIKERVDKDYEPSPMWDIELDDNTFAEDDPPSEHPPQPFDIDLDLN
ncbi:hypothetical protein C0993_000720 [Termitomyces sp. T159_Od127]|nr:hypothetical protein C0993_000720 [Termitomyces sp. T159_Od127]